MSYLLSVGYTCAIFKKCPQDVAIVLKSVSSSCCPMKLRQVTLPPPAQYECVLLLLYSPHDLQTFILIRAKLHSLKEISPSSPSPSIFKTHTIMPTEIKKKKPTPPLPFMPARLLLSGSARQLSRVQLLRSVRFITVNMTHLPSRDLNQTHWFERAIGRITYTVESSSISSSSSSSTSSTSSFCHREGEALRNNTSRRYETNNGQGEGWNFDRAAERDRFTDRR